MNTPQFFRKPPPLSDEPPVKVSTAEIGKIVDLNDLSWEEEQPSNQEKSAFSESFQQGFPQEDGQTNGGLESFSNYQGNE